MLSVNLRQTTSLQNKNRRFSLMSILIIPMVHLFVAFASRRCHIVYPAKRPLFDLVCQPSEKIESRPKLILRLCRRDVHHYCRARGSEKGGYERRNGWIPRFPIVLKSVEVKSKLYELSSSFSLFPFLLLPSPFCDREREREREGRSGGESFDVLTAETKWPACSWGRDLCVRYATPNQ